MGLFTTRQLLGYTEQKVKFRALFLELFFRRTVNFHTEEVMLDKITGKTPVRLVHMDTPSPLTLLVTRKTPSKTSHLTIL
ncbi:hypothetical protein QMY53_00003 [Escherichia coli TW14425]|nr:hypothetical protein QMY53_00003 [Escherichia coli TW14425]